MTPDSNSLRDSIAFAESLLDDIRERISVLEVEKIAIQAQIVELQKQLKATGEK